MFPVKVDITKFESGKFLGYARVGFAMRQGGNVAFTITDFSIFRDEQSGGINVAMPSKKNKEGKYNNILQFTKGDQDGQFLYNSIQEKVSEAYFSQQNSQQKQKKPQYQQNNNQQNRYSQQNNNYQNQPQDMGGFQDDDIPF